MLSEKVDIEVYGRKLTVAYDGLTQLEISTLAQKVDGIMREIAKESEIADSSKLAVLAALEIAADYERLRSRTEDFDKIEGDKVNAMIIDLEKSVDSE